VPYSSPTMNSRRERALPIRCPRPSRGSSSSEAPARSASISRTSLAGSGSRRDLHELRLCTLHPSATARIERRVRQSVDPRLERARLVATADEPATLAVADHEVEGVVRRAQGLDSSARIAPRLVRPVRNEAVSSPRERAVPRSEPGARMLVTAAKRPSPRDAEPRAAGL
jgi:hypothetical protein